MFCRFDTDTDRPSSRWQRVHRHEGGAMALLALAAILIVVMVGLVLFDAAELGTEKTHIQTATDASAYSQATVEAQTMNMVAFANVGKRMTIGMVNTYLNIVQWLTWIGQIATILEYVSYVLYIVPGMQKVADALRRASSAAQDLQEQEEHTRSGNVQSRWTFTGGTQQGGREGAIADKTSKCHYERLRCFGSGCSSRTSCSWCCARDYDDSPTEIWEWAAPITDQPLLLPPYNLMGCGKWALPPFNPLSCADGDIYEWSPLALVENYYGRDLLGYDNYQRYILSVAPYWAWTEGASRGLLNAAPVTISFPMPDFDQDQAAELEMPVHRGEFEDTCERVDSHDRGFTQPMGLDYLISNTLGAVEGVVSGGNFDFASFMGEIVAILVAGTFAFEVDPPTNWAFGQFFPRPWEDLCTDVTQELFADASGGGGIDRFWGGGGGGDYVSSFRQYGEPYLINEYDWGDESEWLLDSSNLMFGYRPNASRMNQGRDKFFVGGDHTFGDGIDEFTGGGTWAVSRGEMSFQDGEPNAWSPAWAARLRPVALPGEWESYANLQIADAFEDISGGLNNPANSPLARATITAHAADQQEDLISHPHDDFLGDVIDEFGAIMMAVEGMTDERMEGLAK